MAQSKKRGVKRKPQAAKPPRPAGVRLSQCMIVKNEEKNIEKALSWAKDIAFEQIVVDTGSTDRTVEIAEAMGAKVVHFTWINDFSAAKNFAIEQCRGNWIALLDADEYFDDTDAKLLKGYLDRVEADAAQRKEIRMIRCRWININDKGEAFNIGEQERVFRNQPEIRYIGAIHEYLPPLPGRIFLSDIKMYHTGYTEEAKKDKNTYERNRAIIEKELAKDPDNIIMKGYLADVLRQDAVKNEKEITAIYEEILARKHEKNPLMLFMVNNAYAYLTNHYITKGAENYDRAMEMCLEATAASPENPDYDFYIGRIHQRRREFAEAWEWYKRCESKAFHENMPRSYYVLARLDDFMIAMMETASELGDKESIVKYASVLIKAEHGSIAVIGSIIKVLIAIEPDRAQAIELLGRFYDYNSISDKVFLSRAAVSAKLPDIAETFMNMISQSEEDWIYNSDEQ
ncbi:MAG: glycosyltransferase [Oscillospiraceae bacterium]|jgi:glycosyltransferase involved in cell wall biosynthesis|nr:glycosyltransferase [Oscillospiraceae bacterium]